MSRPELTKVLSLRMAPRDKRALSLLARHYERPPSEVLRRLIHAEVARLNDIPKGTDHGSEEAS